MPLSFPEGTLCKDLIATLWPNATLWGMLYKDWAVIAAAPLPNSFQGFVAAYTK